MKVSVHGLGKLGLPLACVLAEAGHDVIGTDVIAGTLDKIAMKETPFFEPELDDLLKRVTLRVTPDVTEAVEKSKVHFVVVPTPSGAGGFFTNKYVLEAVTDIGRNLHDSGHVIVICSTVMPGSSRNEIIPAIEKASGMTCGLDFGYCYNPEFIALGSVIHDMHHPDFVLVGEHDEYSSWMLRLATEGVFHPLVPVEKMDIINAEIAKISLNSYITMKISYANQLAEVCEYIQGADASVVARAIGRDRRIGPWGLKPATPYGGPCFPRDSVAFAALAESMGLITELAEATESINKRQMKRMISMVQMHARKNQRVCIMGLSYKAGTAITEEAFGTKLYNWLAKEHYDVVGYDPLIAPNVVWQGATLYVVCTPDPEFSDMDFGDAKVIDCWGIVTTGNIKRIGTNAVYV